MAANLHDPEEMERRIKLVGDRRVETGESTRELAQYFTKNYFSISNYTVSDYLERYKKKYPDKAKIIDEQTLANLHDSVKNPRIEKRVYTVAKMILEGNKISEVAESLGEEYQSIYRDIHQRLEKLDKPLYDKVIEKLKIEQEKEQVIDDKAREKNLYIFLGELALTYRLSLNNLCMLCGIKVTEENKACIHDKIIKYTELEGKDNYFAFQFLFNYETVTESRVYSTYARLEASKFLKKYNEASKEEKEALFLSELRHYDQEYIRIKKALRTNDYSITHSDMESLERYRLKYAIPRKYFEGDIGISRTRFETFESKKEDKVLCEKLKMLAEYYKIRVSDTRKKHNHR